MMQNNIKIAITGGIGSGKSTVAEIIQRLGYAVFSCDKIYAGLLNSREFSEKLISVFGVAIAENGVVSRRKLSELVFSDNELLKKLNELTHPVIIEEAFKSLKEVNIGFCEVPLLFENSYEELFEGVIVVLRNKRERIVAAAKRSKLSTKEIENRINSQFDYDNSNFAKYYVIHNDGDLYDLESETVKIVDKIIKKYFKNF